MSNIKVPEFIFTDVKQSFFGNKVYVNVADLEAWAYKGAAMNDDPTARQLFLLIGNQIQNRTPEYS